MKRLQRIKREVIREKAALFGPRVFVETGTYRGDMVNDMIPHFDQLHTIDNDPDIWQAAYTRFAGESKVSCHMGDTRWQLPRLLDSLNQPALFWLDAHWFGDTKFSKGRVDVPVLAEVFAIMAHELAPSHVILIDDAKVFTNWPGRQEDWPTYDEIERVIHSRCPDWEVKIDRRIIQAHRRVQ